MRPAQRHRRFVHENICRARRQHNYGHPGEFGGACETCTYYKLGLPAAERRRRRLSQCIVYACVQATPNPGEAQHQGSSAPGTVRQVPGGVSRNIAHDLVLLGGNSSAAPLLVSAVGDDAAGAALIRACEVLGLSTCGIETVPGGATPTVSMIFGGGGDVAASVADVALLEAALTPQVLRRHSAAISSARIVIIDADAGQITVEVGAVL